MLIDSHCHLEIIQQKGISVETTLQEFKKVGGEAVVTIGTDWDFGQFIRQFRNTHGLVHQGVKVFHTSGWHPHESESFNDDVQKEVLELLALPGCVGIGEFGLDYYYKHSSPEKQKESFRWQLQLAQARKLPYVIHTRDAEEDTLEILDETKYYNGVIHCFTGTANFAQECVKRGMLLSFSGVVTFKNSAELKNIAQNIPKNRLMIETDSPFLAPIPFRGKTNQPSYLTGTLEIIRELWGISQEETSKILLENTKKFFQFT